MSDERISEELVEAAALGLYAGGHHAMCNTRHGADRCNCYFGGYRAQATRVLEAIGLAGLLAQRAAAIANAEALEAKVLAVIANASMNGRLAPSVVILDGLRAALPESGVRWLSKRCGLAFAVSAGTVSVWAPIFSTTR